MRRWVAAWLELELGWTCIALDNADCERTPACSEQGHCFALFGACTTQEAVLQALESYRTASQL